jgi:hypothetical protein
VGDAADAGGNPLNPAYLHEKAPVGNRVEAIANEDAAMKSKCYTSSYRTTNSLCSSVAAISSAASACPFGAQEGFLGTISEEAKAIITHLFVTECRSEQLFDFPEEAPTRMHMRHSRYEALAAVVAWLPQAQRRHCSSRAALVWRRCTRGH